MLPKSSEKIVINKIALSLSVILLFGTVSVSASDAEKESTPNISALLEDAQSIYDRSVKVFSTNNTAFIVDSEIHYADGETEERAFLLAKTSSSEDKSSVLIRFLAPTNIKCTTVLVNKAAEQTNRFAYFPSLKRTRVIPEKDKQKEVFGIGISYEDLNKPDGLFNPTEMLEQDGKAFYQLTLNEQSKSSVYLISTDEYLLTELTVFRDEQLEKKVKIHQIQEVFGEKMITAWEVVDPKKERAIQYKIRSESIKQNPQKSLFYKNSLSRCRL